MLISCPNCGTRYGLTPAQLGGGKKVSCSSCGHVWFADPKDAQPDPPPVAQPRRPQPHAAPPPYGAPQGYGGYPPQGYPPQQAAQAGYAAQPMAAPPPPPPAPEPAPPPPPPPAPEPEPAPPPAPEPEPEPTPPPAPEPEEEAAALTDDIDSMFEDEEDIEPFQSLIHDDDHEDVIDEADMDADLDETEAIPEVFSPDEQEPDLDIEHPRPWGKVIGITVAVILVAIVAALFFLKDTVVRYVPQLDAVYEMIGFHSLGDGLQIQRVQFNQETESGVEVLVVRGQIQNVTDSVRPVPIIRAVLMDAEGNELQHADTPPLKSELKAKESVSFKVRIKEPSQLRRRINVTFTAPPKGEGEGEGEHK